MTKSNKILLVIFLILYIAVALVSTYHAIFFFALSNPIWLGIILALAFELGQAVVLFTLLTSEKKQGMSWILMGILTAVQVLGNVFSSYKYMIQHNADQIQYFTKSVLFFVQSPNPDYNYVMISYITGAILPIVALCLTSIVAGIIKDSGRSEKESFKTSEELFKENLSAPTYSVEKTIKEPEQEIFIPSI